MPGTSSPPQKDEKFSSSSLYKAIKPILAGAITGGIETFVTYPTEYVKTHLQLQDKKNPVYTGMIDCYAKTLREGGPLGLYRGMAPILIGSIPKQATRWGTYEAAVGVACTVKGSWTGQHAERSQLSLAEVSLCGLVAGSAEACIAVVPMDTIKTQLIDDMRSATPRYKGRSLPFAVADMVRAEGFRGVYKGVGNTVIKQGVNQCVRFPVQLATMRVLSSREGTQHRLKSPMWNGFGGFVAGVVSVVLSQPFDVVKTRMQSKDSARYKGSMDCWRQILRDEGIRTFYSGTLPRMMRVGGNVALTFTIFPLVKQLL